LELRDVSRAVELQFHERVPRMFPDVVRSSGVRPDQVVGVGVRRAGLGELWRGFRVAEREPEPERRPQLEVPGGAAGAARVGLLLRILRQGDGVRDVVARSWYAGLEEDRGLIVAHIRPARVGVRVGAERGVALAERILVAAVWQR